MPIAVPLIDHFTVVGLMTRPLNSSEAGVDLVLIQTSLLLLGRKYPYPTTGRGDMSILPPLLSTPSEFQSKKSPFPLEFLDAAHGMVWIFSGITHGANQVVLMLTR